MLRTTFQMAVLSVSVGSRPTWLASSLLRSKPNAKIRYRQKHAGISTLRKPGWRLADLLRAATITKQPITRQTPEVALSARFSSQSVIAINAKLRTMIFLVRHSLRSDQRVT